ncbi:SCO2400 family protein [Streptomyces afghaniensis]|uniref:SCO2400 family protein n=1 Tax=Streptomyces afghaniensis TaxID=66865 RepID=UPI002786BB36|nr:hypothetical protein [Streptomyces afghaniensis]MDQ1014431.1 hypothetical protein [Streptomyces afghaniensis]
MDYCSSCRRHLNGALVCPGCGAYAPDIDPAAHGRSGPAAGEYPAASGAWRDENVWDDGSVWETNRAGTRELPLAYAGSSFSPSGGHETPATDPSDGQDAPETAAGTDGYQAPQQGRAARRRQMARWKKNQRRAVVATAVALVGGGLTVAAMKGDSTHGVQSATEPGDTTMGGADGEAPTYTEPTSTRRETQRSSRTPATPPHADRPAQREQPRSTAPRSTPADPRTDAATAPRELPKTTQPRTSVPDTGDSVTGGAGKSTSTVTEQQTTPPAAGTGKDSQQDTSPETTPTTASPTPPATPPSGSDSNSKELCLLVICLG